tara:strand:- start:72 stop:659 length:588 start_codon:yes stop_codon:yes gene_type:complete
MNATFKQAIANLSLSDYEHIDQICLMLKERKKEIRLEKAQILKAEKESQKAAAKALKEQEKAVIKAHNQAKKQQEKAQAQAHRIAEKAQKTAQKSAEKAAEKAQKDAQKKAAKDANTLAKLQLTTLKHAKKEAADSPKSKNSVYQNFTKWAKSDDGPSEELINAAGGRREWLKTEWASLTKEQKSAVDAPWNIIV